MRHSGSPYKYPLLKFVYAVAILLSVEGCLHVQKSVETPAPQPDPSAEMSRENEQLQRQLASRDEEIKSLQNDIAGLNMKTLEYEAMVDALQHQVDSHRKRLDTAIIEVVRTKARLRSNESKAEAASTIAEAEIAVNSLKQQASSVGQDVNKEIDTADQLLMMSVNEFKAGNFGGALYLANQAKGQVQALQISLSKGSKKPFLEDEKPFARPLPLKTLRNSNLRGGPGLDQKILQTLSRGTLITGHSYKGSWVHVETADGVFGWLYKKLISPR